ncbi:MAG: ABC transporter substrate-binding protein [Alphaproteobacteria bacterium]|nr:ABC transporter substrate-binding protein [Alphaproteobacteria bacterium]
MTTSRLFPSSRFFKILTACAIAIVIAAAPLMPARTAHAEDKDAAAKSFIQDLGDKALTSLTIQSLAPDERERRVRKLLTQNFDIYTIGRFALGTYWRQASDSQQKQYLKLFEDMIVQTYSRRFADYDGQKFKVGGAFSGGHNDTLVKSEILQKDGPPVHVTWRVRAKNGGMKVVDVVVEEISMSVTQRDDFRSVIEAGGGNVDALLKKLRSSTGNAAKGGDSKHG